MSFKINRTIPKYTYIFFNERIIRFFKYIIFDNYKCINTDYLSYK